MDAFPVRKVNSIGCPADCQVDPVAAVKKGDSDSVGKSPREWW
jgi:hypothetical protein